MPGFDINRFIDLNESLTNNLICSICLNIYDNAVRSECEHTFCKDCVQQWIESNRKECPECREVFPTRKRSNDNRDENNLVLIGNHIFKRHVLINNIINEMKIKCDFDFIGCQQTVQLNQLSTHIRECEHRLCNICGFTFVKTEEHNCIELLKNNRNEWKEKYEKQLEINNKLKEENTENKTKLQTNDKTIEELKQSYDNSVKDQNQWKLKNENLMKINNKLKEENSENETKLQTNEKSINELKQNNHKLFEDMNEWKLNYEKQLKIIDGLKEKNSKIETKLSEKTIDFWKNKFEKTIEDTNQLKGEDITKLKSNLEIKSVEINELNKQLFENNISFQRIKTVIQRSLQKVNEFGSHLNVDPKSEIRHYLNRILILSKFFYSSKHCIQFGNYNTICKSVSFEDKILKFISIKTNTKGNQRVDLNLPLNQLQEVVFNVMNGQNKPFFTIVLKTDKQSCDSIAESLGLDDNSPNGLRFDVNSNDLKHRYITLEFDCGNRLLFDCFKRYLELSELQIKIEEKVLKH